MTKLKEVAYDALREMYSESEPPLDFDEVLEKPENFSEEWYEEYYLDPERQREIVNKYCEDNNLSSGERATVFMNAITYYGPRGTKKDE